MASSETANTTANSASIDKCETSEAPRKTASSGATNNDQSLEVAAIKSAFPNRCRVISDVGQYSKVVTVQPEDLDVTIKFQLPAAYPKVIPGIVIRSESLSKHNSFTLHETLQKKAEELVGQPMIQSLLEVAETDLYHLGLKKGKSVKVSSEEYLDLDQKQKKKKRQKNKKKNDEEEIDSKLPSMKTADDVIKRIIWDENLDKDQFVVGYIDRFRGLVEKYFSAFSWEDLASVDYDVLAVPKHRIQFFKYKEVKVWDKVRRVDNVFGSAEGTKTIDVVMREVEEEEGRANVCSGASKQVNVQNGEDLSDEDSDDDDSSDDDGIVVTVGQSGRLGIGARAKEDENCEEKENDDQDKNAYNPYWRDKLRPNYFIAVRVTSDDILDKVGNVQDHLMEQEPVLAECCIPGCSLHITLCTVGLETTEQLTSCIDALKKVQPDLQASLPKSVLRVHGVSHFYNRVVYAKVLYKPDFLEFCDELKLHLREAGVDIRDGYEFVPHITIMKTTRPVSRVRGSMNINSELYSDFSQTRFGEMKVEAIHLCSMGNARREDGFYLTPLELPLKEQK